MGQTLTEKCGFCRGDQAYLCEVEKEIKMFRMDMKRLVKNQAKQLEQQSEKIGTIEEILKHEISNEVESNAQSLIKISSNLETENKKCSNKMYSVEKKVTAIIDYSMNKIVDLEKQIQEKEDNVREMMDRFEY